MKFCFLAHASRVCERDPSQETVRKYLRDYTQIFSGAFALTETKIIYDTEVNIYVEQNKATATTTMKSLEVDSEQKDCEGKESTAESAEDQTEIGKIAESTVTVNIFYDKKRAN